jgi:MFS family permease
MEKRSCRRLLIIAPITGTAAMGFSAIIPALPELADELGVGLAAIGFLQIAASLPGIFLTAWVGHLADLHGRRRLATVLLVLFGITGTAGAFAPDYTTLLVLRIAMGVPYAGLLALTPAMVGDLFADDDRRRAIGINTAFLTLSSTVAPVLGGLLASGGAQRAFLLYLLAFPVAVLTRLGLPESRPVSQHRGRGSGGQALADLRRRGTLTDIIGSFPYTVVFMAVFVGFSFIVVPVLLSELGLGTAARGPIVGAANLGSAAASLIIAGTSLGARPSRSVVVAQGFAFTGLLLLAFATSSGAVVVGVLLLGLSIGTTYNAMQLFVTSASGPTNRGLVVGAWSSSTRLGQVLGGSLAGVLVTLLDLRAAFFVGAAVVLALAVGTTPLRRLAARSSVRATDPNPEATHGPQ